MSAQSHEGNECILSISTSMKAKVQINEIVTGMISTVSTNQRPAKISHSRVVQCYQKDEECYYVPLEFNPKSIDALFFGLDQQKNTAHVVAVQHHNCLPQ